MAARGAGPAPANHAANCAAASTSPSVTNSIPSNRFSNQTQSSANNGNGGRGSDAGSAQPDSADNSDCDAESVGSHDDGIEQQLPCEITQLHDDDDDDSCHAGKTGKHFADVSFRCGTGVTNIEMVDIVAPSGPPDGCSGIAHVGTTSNTARIAHCAKTCIHSRLLVAAL